MTHFTEEAREEFLELTEALAEAGAAELAQMAAFGRAQFAPSDYYDCSDTLPEHNCRLLDIPLGSSYGQAARALNTWHISLLFKGIKSYEAWHGQEVFWTVTVRTNAGVEWPVFTCAKGVPEAVEKVEKYYAKEHARLLEKCTTDEDRALVGARPLIHVITVAGKDTFIP